ncbi:hypothetical protein [Streptomyces sp. LS1784]|uniref:hypothetical protein n=1 Tax=Streptomyces sp. LS1784 TaxID=2851533 RepID=UPI001CCD962D|nr:hypothetical protein [Streptomyces sp. LS1784]
MVFLVLTAASTTVGAGARPASPPDLSTVAGSTAALVLGLVINPRPGAPRLHVVLWVVLALLALGVAVFAAWEVFDSTHHAAGAALTAALAAFGGLFLDATTITHNTEALAQAVRPSAGAPDFPQVSDMPETTDG